MKKGGGIENSRTHGKTDSKEILHTCNWSVPGLWMFAF